METRAGVESLTARLYRDYLKRTGRLPTDRLKRQMEQKAQLVARRAELKRQG